jgi:RNA polymerase sigma-70 factor (ECF subfamily)
MSESKPTVEDFETVALPHIDCLFRTALRVVGDRSLAEDLIQETFLQAWKSFHRFEAGTNCRAWLFKILFHVVQHHRRKWFRFDMKSVQTTDDGMQETLVYEPPVPQGLSDEDVLLALERIPEQYREVIILADVEEFSYKEIAEALGIPLGTVMSRLNRGRKMLRIELAAFAEGYRINARAHRVNSASA